MKKIVMLMLLAFTLTMCKSPNKREEPLSTEVTNKVVLSSEIKWEQLNPARGDKSPQAGTIWGDRKGVVPTGFLVKFIDGFSSPPHIHNVTYRAMVIKGLIHNDDPNAEKMWMPSGSFWTQPAGESHITAAKGQESIAYVEIDSGPYLVKPTDEKFENGEKPINVVKNNIIWLDTSKAKMIENSTSEIAFLWENNGFRGNLIKLKNGFKGKIQSDGKVFHAVVIEGEITYEVPQTKETMNLDPGSYFSSEGKSTHKINSSKGSESLIYIRTNGEITIK